MRKPVFALATVWMMMNQTLSARTIFDRFKEGFEKADAISLDDFQVVDSFWGGYCAISFNPSSYMSGGFRANQVEIEGIGLSKRMEIFISESEEQYYMSNRVNRSARFEASFHEGKQTIWYQNGDKSYEIKKSHHDSQVVWWVRLDDRWSHRDTYCFFFKELDS